MANVYLQDSTLTAIGNAIRAKAGNTTQLYPSEMAQAITNLPSGGIEPIPAPTMGLGSDGIIKQYGNGYTISFISSSAVMPTAGTSLNLSGLGVTIQDLTEKIFAIGTECKPLVYNNSNQLTTPGKRCRLLLMPGLAKYIEFPADIKSKVANTGVMFPAFISHATNSTATSVTISNTTSPILSNSFLTYLGNYHPVFGVATSTAISVYYYVGDAKQNVFSGANKIVDTGQVIVWRK